MTIRDLQRAIAEVGRIRIGAKVATRGGGSRPGKLEQFRLTSPDQRLIQAAASLYGGTPRPWNPEGRARQFEVYTESDALNVIVPPSDMALTQDYEFWSAGGCQRRCDGAWEQITDRACLCDPLVEAGEPRLCKIHSRLWVMLADMPGLGLWRLETSGWYAARELLGSVDVIKLAAGRGAVLPARLLLEQRQIKRADETVKKFAVPRLDPQLTPNQLFAYAEAPALESPRTLAIETPARGDVEDASASFSGAEPEPSQVETRIPRTCDEAGDRCRGLCTTVNGVIRDPDCFRGRTVAPRQRPVVDADLAAPGPLADEPRPTAAPRCYCGHPELDGRHFVTGDAYCEITADPEPQAEPEPAKRGRKCGNVTPVPQAEGDPPSVREQINSPSRYRRRAIDAPTAGIPPRTVAEAARGPAEQIQADEAQADPRAVFPGPLYVREGDGYRQVPGPIRLGDPTREPGELPAAPAGSGISYHYTTGDAAEQLDDAAERQLGPDEEYENVAAQRKAAKPSSDDDYPLPDEPPPDDAPPPSSGGRPKVTGPQLTKLAMLRQQERYDDNAEGRAQWFAWLSAAIRRTVGSNKDLYKDEASEVIDLLEEAQEQDQRRGKK